MAPLRSRPVPSRAGIPLLVAALLVAASALPVAPLPGPPGAVGTRAAAAQTVASPVAGPAAWDRGAVGAGLALRRLEGVKRVLMIAAHPDDEDTALLAALARGWGAEVAYLSLTRGGGGQNLVGPELGEGLGIVRTGELLAARELDGARQYFTRAFDFGFSKTAEETLALWPREEVLRDVTFVVRHFRPHVVVSVFSGTPSDGHGHHQASGILAREVFRAAADPERFPELREAGVEPWQPARLVRLAWRDPGAATSEVATGTFDPLLGRSHYQVAMESRSQHRSQDMGTAQPPGPRTSDLVLLEAAPGVDPGGGGLFAGVDTTLAGAWVKPLPAEARPPAEAEVERFRTAVSQARERLNALDPGAAVPALARAVEALDALAPRVASVPAARSSLEGMRAHAADALADAAGVVADVRVSDDLVVPGESVEVSVVLWNGGRHAVHEARPDLSVPAGWEVTPLGGDPDASRPRGRSRGGVQPVAPGEVARIPAGEAVEWRFRVRVPADAEISTPYYLEAPRDGAMYRWPDDPGLWGRPLDPPLVTGSATFRVDTGQGSGPRVARLREGMHVAVDKARGEIRQPVKVVPAVSVATEPRVMVWPTDAEEARRVSVALRGFAAEGAAGRVRLEAPPGWEVTPASADFALAGPGEEAAIPFTVRAPAGVEAGSRELRAVAELSAGGRLDATVELVEYPHIRRVVRTEPAATRVTVVPVQVAGAPRVGYVMGSGDDVFDAILELGVDADLLDADQVLAGDLSSYDVLVLGVRAYETRPDVRAANQRLLDFARDGGTLLVQYNKYEFPRGDFAPWPVDMSRPHDRVTDEASPVAFLHPEAPVFRAPNPITEEDFDGWVTERGLYFLGEWDERYTPLLEMEDPGEAPKRGALVVAPLGEGLYVYTGLSFFRQLPAGVPGAYRLFANLLSLDAEAWHAWAGTATDGGSAR